MGLGEMYLDQMGGYPDDVCVACGESRRTHQIAAPEVMGDKDVWLSCPDGQLYVRAHNQRNFTPAPVQPSPGQDRKAMPLFSGCLAYFPDALMAVAKLSAMANDKHNPGEPLHWSKEKSADHADCVARHLLTHGQTDPETGLSHSVALAWRALALLQTELEGKT